MKKDNLPSKIPIFPLSSAIFFPKTTLPLNIFEDRYIQLVNDCMKNNRMFGMVQPKNNKEKVPEVYGIGCLGKIISFNETSDGYIINGSKNWITNAPIADVFIIWALNQKKEVFGFILDKDTKGLSTSYIKNKTSLKISPTGQIIFNNVHISKDKILPNTDGWKSVFSCLNKARYSIGWGVLGAATQSWLIAKEYTENRIMFKKPLAANQLIQKKLADMQSEINIALSACLHTGRAMDKNLDTKVAISILKRNNSKKAIKIIREARDMLGANGLLEENHIMRHLVNLETVKTYEGAEDIHSLILGKFQTNIDAF